MVWKFYGNAPFPHSFGRFLGFGLSHSIMIHYLNIIFWSNDLYLILLLAHRILHLLSLVCDDTSVMVFVTVFHCFKCSITWQLSLMLLKEWIFIPHCLFYQYKYCFTVVVTNTLKPPLQWVRAAIPVKIVTPII